MSPPPSPRTPPAAAGPPVIRVLPETLANQIAAGEVVERPAAVVKELAENSLDAGATRITVRIEDGGRRLIEIEDDGHGMGPADLRLALTRHATSKLAQADDLFRIATLGFRGEALPSIAAVSEFSLASRPAAQPAGHILRLAGGHDHGDEPCAMAPGTRVSVRNLFWNVPARLKFLKAEASEAGHVTDQVVRLALSHPGVAFRLEIDGRATLDLPAGETLATRIRAIHGKELASNLIAVAANKEDVELTGFIAHPREAKPTSKRQFCFLNGRFVKDKLLLAAIREGYKGFLEPRLHASVFLHLDLDPSLVDVNVHPQKAEVRFRREGEVFALISRTLQAALHEHQGGFSLLTPEDRAAHHAATPVPARHTTVKAAAPAAPMVVVQERFLPQVPATLSDVQDPGSGAPQLAEPRVPYAVAPLAPATASRPPATPDPGPRTPAAESARPPGVRRVLQLHRMFLLIETDTGIRLVDQHALHEKALWLALDRTRLEASGRQDLLIPKLAELSAAEVAAVAPLLPHLLPFAIEADVFGPTTIAVRAHPAALRRCHWTAFFTALAEDGDTAKAVDRLAERIGHAAACHAAVKAGQELSPDEQWELVRLLYELDGLEHCPHGRPTTLDLSWTELGKRFQR